LALRLELVVVVIVIAQQLVSYRQLSWLSRKW